MKAITPLIRATLALALLASASAVFVSRSIPTPGWRTVPARHSPILISPPRRDSPSSATVWMEGDSGRTVHLPSPEGRLLEFGICSPWRDEAGRFQVAGRLSCPEGDSSPGCFGLGRVSFPDGRLLDFVATEAPPVSRLCWFPDPRPRVLFAAGDGHLYRCAFEADGDGEGHWDEAPPCPRGGSHGRWPRPRGADVFLSDPSWPSDPRFDRILLVVLKPLQGSGRNASFAGDQLWWVRLDGPGDAIVRAMRGSCSIRRRHPAGDRGRAFAGRGEDRGRRDGPWPITYSAARPRDRGMGSPMHPPLVRRLGASSGHLWPRREARRAMPDGSPPGLLGRREARQHPPDRRRRPGTPRAGPGARVRPIFADHRPGRVRSCQGGSLALGESRVRVCDDRLPSGYETGSPVQREPLEPV